MNLVLCERYSTKMTRGACDKFKASTPERCKGCDGPVADAKLDDPVVLTPPVHAKPKATVKRIQEVMAVSNKKIQSCAKCSESKPIAARGLCGKCWAQEKKAGTLDANYPSAVLPDVDLSKPTPILKAASPRPEAGCTVTLSFSGDDKSLFEFLSAECKRSRRSIDQEILFRLENGVVQ